MLTNKIITFIYFLMAVSISFAMDVKAAESTAQDLTKKPSLKSSVKKSSAKSKSKFKSTVASQKAPSTGVTEIKAISTKSNLSTNIDFNDQTVGGKYQSPMEALSVVEDEKSIDDLIGVRKNFHDREDRAKSMR